MVDMRSSCIAPTEQRRIVLLHFRIAFGTHFVSALPYGARNDLFDFGPPTLCPYGAMKTLRIELPIACYQFPRKFSNLFLPIVSCLLPIASCLLPIPTKVQQSSFACCQLLARRSFSEGGPIAYSTKVHGSLVPWTLCLSYHLSHHNLVLNLSAPIPAIASFTFFVFTDNSDVGYPILLGKVPLGTSGLFG